MSFRQLAAAVVSRRRHRSGSLVAAPPVASVGGVAVRRRHRQPARRCASASLAQASLLPDLLPVIPGLEANPAMLLGFHEIFTGNDSGFPGLMSLAGTTDLASCARRVQFLRLGLHVRRLRPPDLRHDAHRHLRPRRRSDLLGAGDDRRGRRADSRRTGRRRRHDAGDDDHGGVRRVRHPRHVRLRRPADVRVHGVTRHRSGDPDPVRFRRRDRDRRPRRRLHRRLRTHRSGRPRPASRWTSSRRSPSNDLVQLDFPNNAVDDIDIDLALTADVFGTEFGGQLTITDENFFSDPSANIDFSATGANPIDLLTNISADTAITSLAQLVSSYGAAMLAGDVKLPFLSDGVFIPGDLGAADLSDFDRVFEAIQPLVDYVDAAVVRPDRVRHRGRPRSRRAGWRRGDPDRQPDRPRGEPAGVLPGVHVGRRIRPVAGRTARMSERASTTTIGVDPTANIELSADGDGDFAVEIEFTPGRRVGCRYDPAATRDDPGPPHRARRRRPHPDRRRQPRLRLRRRRRGVHVPVRLRGGRAHHARRDDQRRQHPGRRHRHHRSLGGGIGVGQLLALRHLRRGHTRAHRHRRRRRRSTRPTTPPTRPGRSIASF